MQAFLRSVLRPAAPKPGDGAVLQRDSRGFTLIETLVVLGVVAVLMLVGWPKVRTALVKANVRGARSAVINTLQQAKNVAIRDGRRAAVNFSNGDGTMWITATPRKVAAAGSTSDTVGAVRSLASLYGVTVNASVGSYTYDNRGLSTSTADATVLLARAGYQDSVLVNAYGRISK